MKKIISLFVVFVMMFSLSIFTFAADGSLCSVTYESGARDFVFSPDNKDLFQNFKGVMPGDELTQTITVKNTKTDRFINIYLKAEVSEEYKEFLDNMTLTVTKTPFKSTNTTTLSEGKASEANQLSEPILLGTFAQNEGVELNVVLKVDKNMGNEFQNAQGVINWVFTAEEGQKIPVPKPESPNTGDIDQGFISAVIAIVVIAAVAIIFLLNIIKKSDKDTDKMMEQNLDELKEVKGDNDSTLPDSDNNDTQNQEE